METVVKKEEKDVIITSPYPSSLDKKNKIKFTIRGLCPERSIEDRDVFLSIDVDKTNIDSFWLQGEKAIELGLALIQEGNFALNANMIQHQLNYCKFSLKTFIKEKRIDYLKIKEINNKPVNYGQNFHTVNIQPVWNLNKEPKYQEDFNFDIVLYYDSKETCQEDNKNFFDGISIKFI